MKIELKNVQLFAYHGVYNEERRTGNDYLLNLSVEIDDKSHISSLKDTVNYVTLYEIVQDQMSKPTDLLETVVTNIAEVIHERFPQIKVIEISLYKLNPLIKQFIGNVGVTYSKTF